MAMVRKSIGDILVEKNFITAEQLSQAKDVQKSAPGDLGNILVTLSFASERDVVEARAQEMGVPFIDLNKHKPESSAVNVVPQSVAEKHKALPVKKDGNRLWVAMENPKNIMAVDDLRMVSKCLVQPMLAVPSDLMDALGRAYGIRDTSNDRPLSAAAEARLSRIPERKRSASLSSAWLGNVLSGMAASYPRMRQVDSLSARTHPERLGHRRQSSGKAEQQNQLFDRGGTAISRKVAHRGLSGPLPRAS